MMATYPREEIQRIGDDAMQAALAPLSWPLIRDRITHMDHCALGGVSPDATLIASLAVRAHENHTKGKS